MSDKKQRPELIITPAGVLVYPHLNNPDPGNEKVTREKPTYHARIKLQRGEEAVEKLIEKLTRLSEEAYAQAKKENPKLQKQLVQYLPFVDETDDEGNETGFVLLSGKMASYYIDKKTNKRVDMRPALVDAKRKEIDPDKVRIGGGTIAKLALRPVPFLMAATKQAGVSLKLEAVQVIELKTFSGGSRAASMFGEEEGFEAEQADGGAFDGDSDSSGDSDGPAPDEF